MALRPFNKLMVVSKVEPQAQGIRLWSKTMSDGQIFGRSRMAEGVGLEPTSPCGRQFSRLVE